MRHVRIRSSCSGWLPIRGSLGSHRSHGTEQGFLRGLAFELHSELPWWATQRRAGFWALPRPARQIHKNDFYSLPMVIQRAIPLQKPAWDMRRPPAPRCRGNSDEISPCRTSTSAGSNFATFGRLFTTLEMPLPRAFFSHRGLCFISDPGRQPRDFLAAMNHSPWTASWNALPSSLSMGKIDSPRRYWSE
jgi:hypothetical protein